LHTWPASLPTPSHPPPQRALTPDSEGRATQSYLEQIARRTSAVYETITEKDIDPQPIWAGTDAKGAGATFRIGEQLKRRPFQKGGFNLHEYVWEIA
jgi:hypothetical protein